MRSQNIPIDVQLKLFDSLVDPILLYGSKVWGYENLKILEPAILQKNSESKIVYSKRHGLWRVRPPAFEYKSAAENDFLLV
jgi:hypothetical protein